MTILTEQFSEEDLRLGSLEVRLAETPADIDAAQALRYRVFYEEMSSRPTPQMAARRRDFDAFDELCEHLLIVDHSRGRSVDAIVGTYRLIRRSAAARKGGFYSAGEYDIRPIVEYPGEILELGRSCVEAPYRTLPTLQLLWRGIAAYVFRHDIQLMFGCASFPGTDPLALSHELSYLYHNYLAPPELRPVALPQYYTDMRLVDPEKIDTRAVLASLPPLIKGYLRVGCYIGDGAFVDPQFNSVDVCIVVRLDQITDKYYRHYDRRNKSQ
ncbi:MAG: GNAT family N-acetyltransferase [Pseudomonadota bacterium]|nr:GNAT family N-acetyltransferase [Pseudomonadota bacterium]